MKIVKIALVMFLLAEYALSNDFAIDRGKVGNIVKGDSVDTVYSKAGKKHFRIVDLYSEGLFTPALVFKSGEEKLVLPLLIKGDRLVINSIDVLGRVYRTKDGITIETTLQKLRASNIVNDYVYGENGLIAISQKEGLSFVFNPKKVDPNILLKKKWSDLPRDLKIKKIIVW